MYYKPASTMPSGVCIYTDGCCKGNPGVGGYGFVIIRNGEKLYSDFGGDDHTTNNRMELSAIIEALKYCEYNHIESPKIVTDSKFSINVCKAWIWKWLKEGKIEKMKNPDLSLQLIPLLNSVKPSFEWVKGHSGNRWNEYADALSNKYVLYETLNNSNISLDSHFRE